MDSIIKRQGLVERTDSTDLKIRRKDPMSLRKLIDWMLTPPDSAPRSTILIRLIAIPFVIEMVVAILSTKVALYFGTSPLPLPPAPPQSGAWAVLHEISSDYAQIMSVLFLLAAGPGPWSVDAILARLRKRGTRTSSGAGSAIEVGNRSVKT